MRQFGHNARDVVIHAPTVPRDTDISGYLHDREGLTVCADCQGFMIMEAAAEAAREARIVGGVGPEYIAGAADGAECAQE
jgi:hypothetical protein